MVGPSPDLFRVCLTVDSHSMSARMESLLPSAEHSWKTCVLSSQQARNKIYQCVASTWPFCCYSLSVFIFFQNRHTLTTIFKVTLIGIIIPALSFKSITPTKPTS